MSLDYKKLKDAKVSYRQLTIWRTPCYPINTSDGIITYEEWMEREIFRYKDSGIRVIPVISSATLKVCLYREGKKAKIQY